MVLSERPFQLVFAILGEFFLDPHFFPWWEIQSFNQHPFLLLMVQKIQRSPVEFGIFIYAMFYRVLYIPGGWPWDFWTINSIDIVLALLGLYVVGCSWPFPKPWLPYKNLCMGCTLRMVFYGTWDAAGSHSTWLWWTISGGRLSQGEGGDIACVKVVAVRIVYSTRIHGTGIWVFPYMVGFPPKSSILIGFSIINHLFWGTPIFLKHPYIYLYLP